MSVTLYPYMKGTWEFEKKLVQEMDTWGRLQTAVLYVGDKQLNKLLLVIYLVYNGNSTFIKHTIRIIYYFF